MKTINPGDLYYEDRDHPDQPEIEEMWKSVRRSLPGGNSTPIHIHWKSFWIGQAAAILLVLAILGTFTAWEAILANQNSESNDLRERYITSLQEMVRAHPVIQYPESEHEKATLKSRLDGLEELDRMILELQQDIMVNGSTQTKQQQLRRLYATKLDFIKKLILTDENNAL